MSPRIYRLELSRENAPFDLFAKITVSEGYPDNACLFNLSLIPVAAAKVATSEQQKLTTWTAFADGTPSEEVLTRLRKELEEHASDFCQVSKHDDILFSLQICKLMCCFDLIC